MGALGSGLSFYLPNNSVMLMLQSKQQGVVLFHPLWSSSLLGHLWRTEFIYAVLGWQKEHRRDSKRAPERCRTRKKLASQGLALPILCTKGTLSWDWSLFTPASIELSGIKAQKVRIFYFSHNFPSYPHTHSDHKSLSVSLHHI